MGRRRTPELRRKTATVEPAPTVVIVCEGGTESRILDDLRARWRIPSVRVRVLGKRGDPSNVVQCAAREQRSAQQVAVVFDRDEHHHWSGACERSRQLGIRLGVSNPCFELWALLLHEDRTAALERREAQRRLSEVHRGYHHDRRPYLDVELVEPNLARAAARSATLARRAEEAGDAAANPTTSFSDLVDLLEQLARAGRR